MDYLPAHEVKKIQERKLRELIHYCYHHVPYYRKLFKKLKLTPASIGAIEDLKKLPILTKEDIISHHNDFFADNAPKSELIPRFTSGTTGSSLKIYTTENEKNIEYLIWPKETERLKLAHSGRIVVIGMFWGDCIWKWDKYSNHLNINPSFMTEEYFPLIIHEVKKLKALVIYSRPSDLASLARYCIKSNEALTFKIAFSFGEHLLPHYRKSIRKIFSCDVFDTYSQEEGAVRAMECSNHQGMHLEPRYGITEITDNGKIIGTPLFKRAFPLLRYDTGDTGKISVEKCSCGMTSPRITSLQGREGDVLITKEGRLFHTFGIFNLMNLPQGLIEECQFSQKSKGEVLVSLVLCDRRFKKKVIRLIKGNLNRHFFLKFSFLNAIPREKSGKLRLIKSDVARVG